jgi:hypothetical protein
MMNAGPHFRVRGASEPGRHKAWLVERNGEVLCSGLRTADAIELALDLARADWVRFNTRPRVSLETAPGVYVAIAEHNARHLAPVPTGRRYEQWRDGWLRASRAALAVATQSRP